MVPSQNIVDHVQPSHQQLDNQQQHKQQLNLVQQLMDPAQMVQPKNQQLQQLSAKKIVKHSATINTLNALQDVRPVTHCVSLNAAEIIMIATFFVNQQQQHKIPQLWIQRPQQRRQQQLRQQLLQRLQRQLK